MVEYVQHFDVVPQFWQFLRGLRFDDLIVELIQNELDANASRTTITFYADRLVCQGDGEPVSEDGWRRLAFVMGAGDQVESKRFRIGVKNHGLKACFGLGDEIVLRSDGRSTIQTLYKDGLDEHPSPGTLPRPEPDDGAPLTGCLVEVPYRTKRLKTAKGEPFELPPTTDATVEELFWDACERLPERLLGIVAPDMRDQYCLSLNHHRLGSVELHWRAKRAKEIKGRGRRRFLLFNRECKIASDTTNLSSKTIREQACAFKIRIPSVVRHEVPEFFKLDKGYLRAEIAWRTDQRGTPKATLGTRRYPIGYSTAFDPAHTGVGVHFSGPYRSDSERHGVSQQDPLNKDIDDACKNALVEIMACHLLYRHGGKAMELYLNGPEPDEQSLTDMVERSIVKRAIPLLPMPRAARYGTRSGIARARGDSEPRVALGPKRTSSGGVRRIVLPMFSWEKDRISPLLSEICPRQEDQIDKTIPGSVLDYLANTDFVDDIIIRFDERDVLKRLQPGQQVNRFPWEDESEWQDSLGNPVIAKKYLDVVHEAVRKPTSPPPAPGNVYLPDANSVVRPLVELFSAVDLPPNIGELDYVPILHPELKDHRLLKIQQWKPKPFTLNDYLDKAELERASPEDRMSFWQWLRDNRKSVKQHTLQKVARLPVWPNAAGYLLVLDALCEPRDVRIASVMGDAIQRPSPELLKSRLVSKTSRGALNVRFVPTKKELSDFLLARLDGFPRQRSLTSKQRREFHQLEEDLALLASVPQLHTDLVDVSVGHGVALASDGFLRDSTSLVRVTESLARLILPAPHIIDRPTKELDRIEGWKPRGNPTSAQVADALREDGARFDAHIPRLQEYVKQAKIEGIQPDGLRDLPCIPIDGKLHCPGTIALRGRQNYWGDWKVAMPVASISHEVQALYRRVGVVGGEPDTINSRYFFRWLISRKHETIGDHVDQVLRHINHKFGPQSWVHQMPDIPFIPVECNGGGVRLVTKTEAIKDSPKVVIPDFDSLADAIRRHSGKSPVGLAVLSSPTVTEPITSRLRELGLRTLSDFAGEPTRVSGHGGGTMAPDFDFRRILDSLCSGGRGRQLRKRLAKLDVDDGNHTLRRNWREYLSNIQDVKTADSVDATYRLSRNTFSVPVSGELDKGSATLWLKTGSDLREIFFDVIAGQIFTNPPKYLGPVLDRAYRMDMREHYPLEYADNDELLPNEESDDIIGQNSEVDELPATSSGHALPNLDQSRNVPTSDRGVPWALSPKSPLERAEDKGLGDDAPQHEADVIRHLRQMLFDSITPWSAGALPIQEENQASTISPSDSKPRSTTRSTSTTTNGLPPIDQVEAILLPGIGSLPERSSSPGQRGGRPRQWKPPTPDQEERDRLVGQRGEEIVYQQELAKVKALGFQESRVVWVSNINPGSDHDILSVDDDGQDLWVEVKSTSGRDGRFRWTKAEFDKALKHRNYYVLYRVYEADSFAPSVKTFRDPIGLLVNEMMRLDVNSLNAEVESLA